MIEQNRENLSTRNFFTQINFNVKISQSTVLSVYYQCENKCATHRTKQPLLDALQEPTVGQLTNQVHSG